MVRGAKLNNSSSNRRYPALWVAKSGPTIGLAVYSSLTKTAEALSGAVNTQLKQGANERVSWG
jgi:hypothetical protein